ncbi:MAG: hypothetical protein AB1486_22485 [Planctomycetota bacterium]
MSTWRTEETRARVIATKRASGIPCGDRPRASQRGATLISTLVFVIVIAGTSSSLLLVSTVNTERVTLNSTSVEALQTAQVGVAQAMYELSIGADMDDSQGIGNVEGSIGKGDYGVTATPLDGRFYRLDATGRISGVSRRIEVIVAPIPTTVFKYGLGGVESMSVSGGFQTDSFDRDLGTYYSQAVNVDDFGVYATPWGHIGCNGTLSVGGASTIIRGDARPGPGVNIDWDGNATILGTTRSLEQTLDFPPPEYSEFEEAYNTNDNAKIPDIPGLNYDDRDMSLSLNAGAVLNLPPGTYFFSSLRVNGGASLVVTGTTKIYLIEDLDATGGSLINPSGEASNFSFVAYPYRMPGLPPPPRTVNVNFSGSSDTAFSIYAPAHHITIGGGTDVFGAIVGHTIDARGAFFHYDESLGYHETLEFQPYGRVAYRELSQPAL